MSRWSPFDTGGGSRDRSGGADESSGSGGTGETGGSIRAGESGGPGRAGGSGPRLDLVDGSFDLRRPALLGVVALILAYLQVIYHVTDVVGGTATLVLVVLGTAGLATALGKVLRVRTALLLSAVLLVGGLLTYFFSVPESQRALFTVERVVSDTLALLTGLSVLRLTQAQVWALTVVPGPLFLSWYLAVRGRFVGSVAVGGAALFFFVLTGDATVLTTLVGVAGMTAAVALDTLGERGALEAQWDTVALVLAVMVVLSASLSVVPGGAAQQPWRPFGGGESTTTEASLVSNDKKVSVVGSLKLSPKVRFTVEADSAHYWRTGAYDRYTGGDWLRTEGKQPYDGRLSGPPGESKTVEQEVTAKTKMNAIPAAWKPVEIDGDIARAVEVTNMGGFRAATTVREEEEYTVTSEVPRYTSEQLRTAGTSYPAGLQKHYTQLPQSTPDRLGRKTTEIVQNASAETPYEKARAIESYLEENKAYSLDVERPDGDIATAFLFEMEEGYCTYYATAMVSMLRSQGVPARFVTGYTTGERIGQDEWVVRGLDAHAWVEVYFPGVGWVPFDPTPAGPREDAEQQRVDEARQNDESDVDVDGSGPDDWTPTPDPTDPTPDNGTDNGTDQPGNLGPRDGGLAGGNNGSGNNSTVGGGDVTPTVTTTEDPGAGGFEMPSRETLGYGLVGLVGLAAGARRFGLTGRAYRALWLYHQGSRREPDADVERAFARLEHLLAREYRPRRPGETPRAYLAALDEHPPGIDERARMVGRIHERARYGDGVDRAAADDAVAAVDALVRESTPLVGRFYRRSGDRPAA